MGVPSFYRWLVGRYPKTVVDAVEEPAEAVDYSQPNPNGVQYDNLYLDMNGIIHPCFHPDAAELLPPTTFEEVFAAVFHYIDRVFRIVRPRKLLYLAVDGVAPRAKMNQQRARRFRAAKDAEDNEIEAERLRQEYEKEHKQVLPNVITLGRDCEVSDPNVITPGTVFMEALSKALEYYIRSRLNTDPGWKLIKVILSDANVPGEGEHKIMAFIRGQRTSNGYNPNTCHCLYGLDADLIMLSLVTHEVHFSILREDVSRKDQQENSPAVLETTHCERKYESKEKRGFAMKPYQFLNIWTLRYYLEMDFVIVDPPFEIDIERIIDDFVFICLLAGNDFLPKIPSLEIHEGAIDLLIEVYKKVFREMGGHLIDSTRMKEKKHAYMKFSRVKKFIAEVGSYEEKIFAKRKEVREKGLKKMLREISEEQLNENDYEKSEFMSESFAKQCVISSATQITDIGRVYNSDILNNTFALRRDLKVTLSKKQDLFKSGVLPSDKVNLGSPGWKTRYYKEKFSVKTSNEVEDLQKNMVEKYTEGLCWTLEYYLVGVCSWNWYYPYHYGPFASDLKGVSPPQMSFKIGKPFKPFDQLMAVLPPRSASALPKAYRDVMNSKDSMISKFYPTDFETDVSGKRFLWQGVVKLPFIEEQVLLSATKNLERDLDANEVNRNSFQNDKIFARKSTLLGLHMCSTRALSAYDSAATDSKYPLHAISCEISGSFSSCGDCSAKKREDVAEDCVISAIFYNPNAKACIPRLLPGVVMPEKMITEADIVARELWHESSGSRLLQTKAEPRYRHESECKAIGSHASQAPHRDLWQGAGSGWSTNGGRGKHIDVRCEAHREASYGRGHGSLNRSNFPGTNVPASFRGNNVTARNSIGNAQRNGPSLRWRPVEKVGENQAGRTKGAGC